MAHHLKKKFTRKEIQKIITMSTHKKTKAEIAKELHCDFYRVQRQIEIIKHNQK